MLRRGSSSRLASPGWAEMCTMMFGPGIAWTVLLCSLVLGVLGQGDGVCLEETVLPRKSHKPSPVRTAAASKAIRSFQRPLLPLDAIDPFSPQPGHVVSFDLKTFFGISVSVKYLCHYINHFNSKGPSIAIIAPSDFKHSSIQRKEKSKAM